MSPPRFTILEVERREWPFRLRLPFRFGVITVTEGRQAVLRARIRDESGREGWGVAAESLAAKWFDKDPALSDHDNQHQLRRALELAADAYRDAGPRSAFALYADTYAPLQAACAAERLNPLVAGFGPAMLDRAILDALCRAHGTDVFAALRANLPGLAPHPAIPDLAGFGFDALLARLRPAPAIEARHTVGLLDPLTAADQAARIGDGLPETLEEVCAAYGHRWFKLKLAGDPAADIDRLARIAAVLDRLPAYRATLDGNEQYQDADAVLALLRAMQAHPGLARLAAALAFVEQPIRRAAAFSAPVAALAATRPVLIDESDETLDAFPRAQALGYTGVSSKLCKGLYKSLVNRARIEGRPGLFMSAEDLTTLPGLAVQQDLALVSFLGIGHVERNGHHFIDGFAGRPEAPAFRAAHPDLYGEQDGHVRLRIRDGRIALASLACPGFAAAVHPDPATLDPMPPARWPPAQWPPAG
jgi:hypothetical protein